MTPIEKCKKILLRLLTEGHLNNSEHMLLRNSLRNNNTGFLMQNDKSKCKNLVKNGKHKGKPHCTVFKSICPSRCKEEKKGEHSWSVSDVY